MNIRILAASALALAILVPTANAATPNHRQSAHRQSAQNPGTGLDMCPRGNLNLGTLECVPWVAKVVHARVVKHVVKPVSAYSRMMDNTDSHEEESH
jgi:hypothetical protein